jgi:carboxymethylenebutenolidase
MGKHVKLDTSSSREIGAYLATPSGKPKGGIVVIQEIFGVNAHIRSIVDRYAEAGFTAIAPAVFDHLEPDVQLGYDQAGMEKGVKLIAELGLVRALYDVEVAASEIAEAGNIGTVGYCWGGTIALMAALRLGFPSASYYGARNVPFLTEEPKAPVIFHFGEKDHSIPPEMVAKHRELMPQMETFVYPADHGFNCDARGSYDAPSAKLAWDRTLAFFEKNLA